MFASIRHYQTTAAIDISRKVNEGFVPLISKIPGFVSYYGVDSEDGQWTSISIFETKAEADASNELAASWAREHVAPLLSGKPEITEGRVIAYKKRAEKL